MTDPEKTPGSIDQVLRAVQGSRVSLFRQDMDLKYQWIENPFAGLSTASVVGLTDMDILPEPAASIATSRKRAAIMNGESCKFDLSVLSDGLTRIFEVFVCPEFDLDGNAVGLTGSVVDISRERQQAQSMANLILEVSHRSKNLLAIVQSIASQTVAGENSAKSYSDRFVSRLQCLSRTQDIVTARDWQGAGLIELINAQIDGTAIDGQILMHCADIFLTPSAALHVGLAMHELIQNAEDNAHSPLSMQLSASDDAQMPTMISCRTVYRDPGSRKPLGRFSCSVLERAAPQSVSGKAQLQQDDNVLVYALCIGSDATIERGF